MANEILVVIDERVDQDADEAARELAELGRLQVSRADVNKATGEGPQAAGLPVFVVAVVSWAAPIVLDALKDKFKDDIAEATGFLYDKVKGFLGRLFRDGGVDDAVVIEDSSSARRVIVSSSDPEEALRQLVQPGFFESLPGDVVQYDNDKEAWVVVAA